MAFLVKPVASYAPTGELDKYTKWAAEVRIAQQELLEYLRDLTEWLESLKIKNQKDEWKGKQRKYDMRAARRRDG